MFFENAINLLFIQPIAFALPAICAVDIFYGEKNSQNKIGCYSTSYTI